VRKLTLKTVRIPVGATRTQYAQNAPPVNRCLYMAAFLMDWLDLSRPNLITITHKIIFCWLLQLVGAPVASGWTYKREKVKHYKRFNSNLREYLVFLS